MELVFDYLSKLEQHNERAWYHANKAQHKKAKEIFEDVIQSLLFELGQSDASILHHAPKDLTFKVVRDMRFSADKSPYNPAFRAHISSRGKLPIPVGYFLFIKPNGRSFLGGGLFTDMFKDATAMIRDAIAENPEEWNAIITAPSFVKLFSVKGTALKNVPRMYDKDHPQGDYLKNKSWYIDYPLTDEQVLDQDFAVFASTQFEAMQAFNAFLNRALEDFTLPTR